MSFISPLTPSQLIELTMNIKYVFEDVVGNMLSIEQLDYLVAAISVTQFRLDLQTPSLD